MMERLTALLFVAAAIAACGGKETKPATVAEEPAAVVFDLFATHDTDSIDLRWEYPAVTAEEWSLLRQVNGGAATLLAALDPAMTQFSDPAVTDYNIYQYRITGKMGSKIVARSRAATEQFFSWSFPQVDPGTGTIDTYLTGMTPPVLFSAKPFRIPVTSNWRLVKFECGFDTADTFFTDCPEGMIFDENYGNYNPEIDDTYALFVRAVADGYGVDKTPLPVTFITDFQPPLVKGNLHYSAPLSGGAGLFAFVPTMLYDQGSTSVTVRFSGDITDTGTIEVYFATSSAIPLPVPSRLGTIQVNGTVIDKAGHVVKLNCSINIPTDPVGEIVGPDC